MLEEFIPEHPYPLSDLTLAGAGNRLIAAIIDNLLIGIVCGIFLVPFIFIAVTDDSMGDTLNTPVLSLGIFFMLSLLPILSFGYFAFFESSAKQATFGKQAMKIKVVSSSGQRITFLNALGRRLAKILSSILYIGYLMIIFRKDERGMHDLIADTYVVRA